MTPCPSNWYKTYKKAKKRVFFDRKLRSYNKNKEFRLPLQTFFRKTLKNVIVPNMFYLLINI